MYVYWTTCFQYGLVDHSLRYDCVCILNDVFPAWTRWSFITLRLCVYIERRVSSMDSLIIHYVTSVCVYWTTCFQHELVDHSIRYDCVCLLNDVFPVWTRWSFITLRVCVYTKRRVSSMDSLIIHYVTICVCVYWTTCFQLRLVDHSLRYDCVCILNDAFPAWTRWSFITLRLCVYIERRVSSMNSLIIHYVTSVCVYWTTCFQYGLVDHSLRYDCVCILNDVFPVWTRWSFITLRLCVYIERRVSSMDSLIIHYVTIVCVYWTTCFQYGLVDHSLRYDC